MRELNFGNDFGEAVINVNGATVEIHPDGSIDTRTAGVVHVHPPETPDTVETIIVDLKPGEKAADGTIFAGISPDTGRPMYTTPADAPFAVTFQQATNYANSLEAFGHRDWRVPTKAELNVLFNSRAAIGGFDCSDLNSGSWYWSSTPTNSGARWQQRFSNGFQYWNFPFHAES